MAELKADVVVLGAGMVGVGAALHLQKRGRDVILVDRHELAGEETELWQWRDRSNAPRCFPICSRGISAEILRYALNRAPQVRYRFTDLPAFLPWLVRYYRASSPERALHSAMAELPLIQRSLIEHEALIAEAEVPELLRRTGWIKLFRADATLAKAVRDARARQAIWRRGRRPRRQGDRGARAASDRRLCRRGAIFPRRASSPIPADWRKPMRRCSAARAAAFCRRCPHARTVRRTLAGGDQPRAP